MKNSNALAQIEMAIGQLSFDERLQLVGKIVTGLQRGQSKNLPSTNKVLAKMAADPAIQREIAQIDKEFASFYSDGLQ